LHVVEHSPTILVVGGANTDYLVRGRSLPKPGETVQGDEFIEAPGGKGVNQAVAAARLGAIASLVARVGRDERGAAIIAALRDEGVDAGLVFRDEEAMTGVALIQVDDAGEKAILTAAGANRQVSTADIDAAADALKLTKVLLLQLEIALESTMAAAARTHRAGGMVILDAGPATPVPDDFLRETNVVRANAAEAGALTGIPVHDRASAHRAAEDLLRRGVELAAVQAGSEGNLLVWREGEVWLSKVAVAAVDATGAGDAFAAGLAVSLAEGRPVEEAGRFANAAAALATTVLGAQAGLPRRGAVEALLRDLDG